MKDSYVPQKFLDMYELTDSQVTRNVKNDKNHKVKNLKGDITMTRIEKIRKFKEVKDFAAEQKRRVEKHEYEVLSEKIKDLQPRIKELLETANESRTAGIDISGFYPKCPDDLCFIVDLPSGNIGKIAVLKIDTQGLWDFYTDGDESYEHRNTDPFGKRTPSRNGMKEFVERFEMFELMFYEYVDSVIQQEIKEVY